MNSQEYIEVSLALEPFTEENAEILMAELEDLPFESFVTEAPFLKCYVQKDNYDPRALKLVLSGIEGLGFSFDFKSTLIPPVNWNAVWESQFPPLVVDGKCMKWQRAVSSSCCTSRSSSFGEKGVSMGVQVRVFTGNTASVPYR